VSRFEETWVPARMSDHGFSTMSKRIRYSLWGLTLKLKGGEHATTTTPCRRPQKMVTQGFSSVHVTRGEMKRSFSDLRCGATKSGGDKKRKTNNFVDDGVGALLLVHDKAANTRGRGNTQNDLPRNNQPKRNARSEQDQR
jgi:hypothetical protein